MRVGIALLGRFEVAVDACVVPAAAWRRRQAAALVKMLALAPSRTLHREQVIDRLWPDLLVTDALPRLHKVAYHARQALGRPGGVVLAAETVTLFPDDDVRTDVEDFVELADSVLAGEAPEGQLERALEIYRGELLPADRYDAWLDVERERLTLLHRRLLGKAGRWEALVAVDPTDEAAHVGLLESLVSEGDRAGALAQYDRLVEILEAEGLGGPGPDARRARDAAEALSSGARTRLEGQRVRFCRTARGIELAYAAVGNGPPLVKAANWLTHLEYDWESIVWRHWLRELSRDFRLIRYDVRGSGLSSWDTDDFSLEAWVQDLETVVDHEGLERFPLLGVSQGAAVAVEYASRHPERVSRLVLYGGYVHGPVRRARDPEARRAAELRAELAELGWGTEDPAFRHVFTVRFMPEGSREQWDDFDELQRRTTSPQNAARFMRATADIDVSDAATRVRAPTLVLHARDDRLPPLEQGRMLAALIPDSRFVSLESCNHLLLESEPAWARFLDELRRFLDPDRDPFAISSPSPAPDVVDDLADRVDDHLR